MSCTTEERGRSPQDVAAPAGLGQQLSPQFSLISVLLVVRTEKNCLSRWKRALSDEHTGSCELLTDRRTVELTPTKSIYYYSKVNELY